MLEKQINICYAIKRNLVKEERIMSKKELLAVSFGTSFAETREKTIGAIENALREAFPEYTVSRAFTSNKIRKRLRERDGIEIDSVTKALQRAAVDNIEELIIQPTHMMAGHEYNKLLQEVSAYTNVFPRLAIAYPLLHCTADFYALAQTITTWTAQYDNKETAICFMGHGTDAQSNAVYQKLEDLLHESGHENYFIGTVEGMPTVNDILAKLRQKTYTKVVLQPLMVVAGDHACNDMAGEDEDSWKNIFERAGYEVRCILRGLGENAAVQQMYAHHAHDAVNALMQN